MYGRDCSSLWHRLICSYSYGRGYSNHEGSQRTRNDGCWKSIDNGFCITFLGYQVDFAMVYGIWSIGCTDTIICVYLLWLYISEFLCLQSIDIQCIMLKTSSTQSFPGPTSYPTRFYLEIVLYRPNSENALKEGFIVACCPVESPVLSQIPQCTLLHQHPSFARPWPNERTLTDEGERQGRLS